MRVLRAAAVRRPGAPRAALRLLASLCEPLSEVPFLRRLATAALALSDDLAAFHAALLEAGSWDAFEAEFGRRLPVLLYHRVGAPAAGDSPGLTVAPERFAEQIDRLARMGFVGIRPSEWTAWRRSGAPLPRRPVLICFDDAYAEVAETAFPVLERRGFGAGVFAVAQRLGGVNDWDAARGFPAHRLMDAAVMREWSRRGIEFGSHGALHADLTRLDDAALAAETRGSRETLERELGVPVAAFAYPFSGVDARVRTAAARCYDLAFGGESGLNGLWTDPYLARRTAVKPGELAVDTVLRARLGWSPLDRLRRAVVSAAAAALLSAAPARAQLLIDPVPSSAGGDVAGLQYSLLNDVDALSAAARPPRLQYGSVRLKPYYNLTEAYDDNIYLAPRGGGSGTGSAVTGSWITDNNLGFSASAQPSTRHTLDLAYDFTSLLYQKNPGVNDAVDQAVGAGYAYSGPAVSVKARDSYVNTSDPSDAELIQRYKRWENIGGAELEYRPFTNVFVSADGSHQTDKYVADAPAVRSLLDRYQDLLGGRAGWDFGSVTRVYAAYHAQTVHFTDFDAASGGPDRNNRAQIAVLGFDGAVREGLTAKVETGYTYTQFDAPAIHTTQTVWRIWSFLGGLTYKPWERTEVDLNVSRGLAPAVLGANQFYVATSASAHVLHRFPWKLTAGLGGTLERDVYETPVVVGNSSATIGTSAGLNAIVSYDFADWSRVSATYMYLTRTAALPNYGYVDQRTGFSLTFRL